MMLNRSVQRRGLGVLLADMFLMMAGFFMLVPLLSGITSKIWGSQPPR